MHYHALLFITVQVSVSVYSMYFSPEKYTFQAALSSPFKMTLLLYRTNLQLSENKPSFLLLLIIGLFFQFVISISLFYKMSTDFLYFLLFSAF